MRTPILFVAEAVTLSQVTRLAMLASSLDPTRYDVHFASADFPELVFAHRSFRRWPIHSIAKDRVDRAMVKGKRLYEVSTLSRYVDEERRLIDVVRPALVVSDFRLSMSVSAPSSGVPFAALIDAYWSPHAVRDRFPVPDHPMVRLLGVEMAERYFPRAMPAVFAHFAKPVNLLRRRYGLSEIGSLREVLTYGDHVLFPDEPSLVPTKGSPAHHRYLGPVIWSPDITKPSWWDRVGVERPCVYVTLGSSGSIDLVPVALDALRNLDVDVMLATASRYRPSDLPDNVHVADFLDGTLAARKSAVVVCNGGASTAYQALAEGVPVVGLPFNLDAYLSMTAIRDASAGVLIRAGTATAVAIREAVLHAMTDASMKAAAQKVAHAFSLCDWRAAFRSFVDEVTAPQSMRQGARS